MKPKEIVDSMPGISGGRFVPGYGGGSPVIVGENSEHDGDIFKEEWPDI